MKKNRGQKSRDTALLIKGSLSRDFLPYFHELNPSGSLINSYFRILFRFRRDIGIFKKLCGVHYSEESASAVSIIPRSQTLRCASHCCVKKTKYLKKLCGVQNIVESNSGMCITPLCQESKISQKTLQCS